MNWDQIRGNWKQLKGSARKAWGDLTDDDLDKVEGERERLVGKIQVRYGVAKEEAERRVDAWVSSIDKDTPKDSPKQHPRI
jgi:uncharacterized protein YjbJ (UPF0337 family)